MNSLETTKQYQGKWFLDAISLLKEHPATEVLPTLYDLSDIEKYLNKEVARMKQQSIILLSSLHFDKATGEQININDFIEYELKSEKNKEQLIKYLSSKKITTLEIEFIYNQLKQL